MNTLADARSRLYAAVLSDVLDSIGLRNQAMEPAIRALDTARRCVVMHAPVCIGRASRRPATRIPMNLKLRWSMR